MSKKKKKRVRQRAPVMPGGQEVLQRLFERVRQDIFPGEKVQVVDLPVKMSALLMELIQPYYHMADSLRSHRCIRPACAT